MSTDQMLSFRTHLIRVKYEHFASLKQTMYHSMNNLLMKSRLNNGPLNEVAISNSYLFKHIIYYWKAVRKASFRDFSLHSVVYTGKNKYPNGYANSHSLFTDISTLNLTYCYIHTNRHKRMYFMYRTKTGAKRK